MTKKFNIAVLGATGLVGETIMEVLSERNFPVDKFYPLASKRSAGSEVTFNNKPYSVIDVDEFDFSKADIALFSAGGSVSEKYAPIAAAANCVVIDNTSHFRNDPDVPLIVPEVNAYAIVDYNKRNIIANPNCSTIQMLVALKPLHDYATITRINVCTYQAVSGSGKSAVKELSQQTVALLNFKELEKKVYPKQIAFNLLPHIDTFQENGYTREEMKMVWETKKILNNDEIAVNPTCVRVPVFFGHSEAINIETREKITAEMARELLSTAPGVEVVDSPSGLEYPTPVTHGATNDPVYVGRIREDISNHYGLNLWVVADNIRKGAALNAVQIAEILLEQLN